MSFALGFGIGLSFVRSSGGVVPPPPDWILITGLWADSGEWDDTAVWNDGA